MGEKKTQSHSSSSMIHFKWGGTTSQWEEEADQLMNCLQDQVDSKEDDVNKEKKIEFAKQKQYW